MKTLVIGRSPFADIVVADESVAPHHAELIVTDKGRLYLVDCASAGGTWRRTAGEGQAHQRDDECAGSWDRVRQAFVASNEPLRLADYHCTAGSLVGAGRDATSAQEGAGASASGAVSHGASRGDSGRQPLRGRVERDAVTGEIVRRRP